MSNGLKTLARNAVRGIANSEAAWSFVRATGLSRIRRLAFARAMVVRKRVIASLGHPCRVPSGPFEGLVVPDTEDRGGGWMARVLGTYESELITAVEEAIKASPTHVIDIGCAEGYYAVGLASRMPNARVDAYDIVESERALCKRSAVANGVSDRVFVYDACSEQTLLSPPPRTRCLVVSDCEGAERDLLTAEVIAHHANSWFIVECHDFVYPGISERLAAMFELTHVCRLINSLGDDEKAEHFKSLPVVDRECREVRAYIYGEGRPCRMTWLIASPRA